MLILIAKELNLLQSKYTNYQITLLGSWVNAKQATYN